MQVRKLDPEAVKGRYDGWSREKMLEELKSLQVAVYVAAGGGMIGRMYAEQPADAYVDGRVGGRPYPLKALYNMVVVLVALAELLGLDPHNLPDQPRFHNCGIF